MAVSSRLRVRRAPKWWLTNQDGLRPEHGPVARHESVFISRLSTEQLALLDWHKITADRVHDASGKLNVTHKAKMKSLEVLFA